MGGNKKNGKKKKKEQEEKTDLSEVDREYYEIQLSDLNRKLNRLKIRSTELENTNLQLEADMKRLDEDRADIIAYLKKILETKTSELAELRERFDGLKQSTESGVQSYEEKIHQMEQEYKSMQDELTAEIKLLMGKLNSLEEFRTQKEELTAKFIVQEEKMAEQEKLHEKRLYESEKNFTLKKNKLKKEMETRLLQLSLNFQQATDVKIAAITQKMIRENISINNELTTMKETQKEMMTTHETIKRNLKETKLFADLQEKEKNKALKKYLITSQVVAELLLQLQGNAAKIKELTDSNRSYQNLKQDLKEKEQKLMVANEEIEKLKDRLAAGQSNAAKLYADIAALKLNSRRLYGILHRAVFAVKEALDINDKTQENEEVILSKRQDLLNNLLQILNRAEMSEKERYTAKTISFCYKKGDLGLVPKDQKFTKTSHDDISTSFSI